MSHLRTMNEEFGLSALTLRGHMKLVYEKLSKLKTCKGAILVIFLGCFLTSYCKKIIDHIFHLSLFVKL